MADVAVTLRKLCFALHNLLRIQTDNIISIVLLGHFNPWQKCVKVTEYPLFCRFISIYCLNYDIRSFFILIG